MHYVNPDLLWTPEKLQAHLEDSDLVVLDLRTAEQYAQGHIPGARSLDLFGISLIDTRPGPLKAFLWIIEHLIAGKGVSNDSRVVAYDDISGERAARLFWFMELFGHDRTHVLDGGISAWRSAGLPVIQAAEPPERGGFQARLRPERLATVNDVLERLHDPRTAIIDVRSDAERDGTLVRAARGGYIPGSIHLEWKNNLDASGRFKTAEALQTMYAQAGLSPDEEIIPYCQGGYRAANTYLALRLLGYPRVRNYLGSWNEWGNRTDLPVEQTG